MFPESSGAYIAQREQDLILVKVKGVYPSLQLDKSALDIGSFLRSGKVKEVSKETLDNMELFHTDWNFIPLDFINFGVFSKTDFAFNSSKLYLSEEDALLIQGKYYRMCQQGVSPMKIIRALSYEFKVSTDQIIPLINKLDAQAVN